MDAGRSLLLECLLAAAEPRPALPGLAAGAHGPRFVTLARRWAVSENAAHALVSAGALAALGERAAAALRDDLENATAANAQLLAEAVTLQRVLHDAGIASVALKGAALIAAHYPAVGSRHLADLDLLVPAADALRAAALLRGAGCVADAVDLPRLDGRPAQQMPAGRHHLPLLWTRGGVPVELHYALPGVPAGTDAAAGVLGRAREVRWGGGALRIPCRDDLLGMACAHALGPHRGDLRYLPRHLSDVAVLLAAGADRDRATALSGGSQVVESVALLERARGGDVSLLPWGGAWAPLARGRILLLGAGKARRRGELWRVLFPARAYLASRYGVSRRSPWLPLLWAWRPIRALLRIATGR